MRQENHNSKTILDNSGAGISSIVGILESYVGLLKFLGLLYLDISLK